MAARRVTGNSVPSEVEKYRVLQEENEMKLKKQVVLGMTAAVAAAVTGCSSSGDTATNAAAEVTTAAETGETTAEETEAETETEAAETEAAGEEEAENEENYDTGDASLDNSRNQDEIGESELLVASFGTSYNDNRRLTIGAIEEAMEAAFPDYSVRRGFTSQIIIDHVKDRDGEVIDNMTEAFNRAIDNGVKILVIQPTHLMDGLEYSDVVNEAAEFSDSFEKIAIGRPLLDTDADFEAVIKAITEATAEYDDGETAICFMGHGTEAESNQVYGKMQDMLTAAGYENYFVGTVEAEPGLEDMLAAVGEGSYKKAVLLPLMIVAGDHANNDMAGDDDDSWKSMFTASGLFDSVDCQIMGLGRMEAVQQLYVAHSAAVIGD